jgi:hypothetical protein
MVNKFLFFKTLLELILNKATCACSLFSVKVNFVYISIKIFCPTCTGTFQYLEIKEIKFFHLCRCKICYKVILFESDTIQRHLSKSHKTNLGLYRLEYLNRMQQPQQQQPLQMTTNSAALQ